MNRPPTSLLLAAAMAALLTTTDLHSQGPNIIPRHPFAIELPEYGRMECQNCGIGEDIYPLPDLNGDGIREWATRSRPRDSSGAIVHLFAKELRIYYGVRDGLPDVDDYLLIKPTEDSSMSKILAAGDWDDNGYPDLAVAISLIGDSSEGGAGFDLYRIVIFWNDGAGGFSLADTTRIPNPVGGNDLWLGGGKESIVHDYDKDGVDDVLLDIGGAYKAGQWDYTARRFLFLGVRNKKWGKEGVPVTAAMEWWNPVTGSVELIDQDADGEMDHVFYHNSSSKEFAVVRIIYGVAGEMLDTNNVVEVDLAPAWGKYALFADVTGDGVVPELLVNTGGQERLKVYVGFKGQRIAEQFGSGADSARPGEEEWWGRPWASLPLPGALHDGWAPAGWSDIYDNGDGGLDGIGDIWVITTPDMVFYNGGKFLDSLYDGWISGGGISIGDIDGSGIPTIVTSRCSPPIDCVEFIKPSKDVPEIGRPRLLPPGTEKQTVGVANDEVRVANEEALELSVYPNPSSGEVVIEWRSQAPSVLLRSTSPSKEKRESVVRITDVLGQEVLTVQVPAYQNRYIWNASKTFEGRYFINITINGVSRTTAVDIQR